MTNLYMDNIKILESEIEVIQENIDDECLIEETYILKVKKIEFAVDSDTLEYIDEQLARTLRIGDVLDFTVVTFVNADIGRESFNIKFKIDCIDNSENSKLVLEGKGLGEYQRNKSMKNRSYADDDYCF